MSKIKHIKLIVVSVSAIANTPCMAEAYEKNEKPCVAELCIGDGITELAKVKWNPAFVKYKNGIPYPSTPNVKVSESSLKGTRKIYPDATKGSADYLDAKRFDNTALPYLAKVSAQCIKDALDGTYITASGNPTRVRIELMPDPKDFTKQSWSVVLISRSYPTAVTEAQITDIKSQVRQRYQNIYPWHGKGGNPKRGEPTAFVAGVRPLTLNLTAGLDPERGGHRSQHPLCGGTAKITLD